MEQNKFNKLVNIASGVTSAAIAGANEIC